MKFYPVLYLGLLLSEKRYRECVLGCVIAGATLLLSVWLLGPSVPTAWQGMQAGLEVFRTQFMLNMRPNEIGFDHSLFGVVKVSLALLRKIGIGHILPPRTLGILLSAYLGTAAVIGTTLYFRRIRFLPLANQVLCLAVACVLLPPVSFDYTLLHLYAPWALLCVVAVRAAHRGITVDGLPTVLTWLAVALSPLSEFIFRHERFGGQMRCLVLLVLFLAGLRFPFPDIRARQSSEPRPQTAGTDLLTHPDLAGEAG